MDKHSANDPNNPINCTEELDLCSGCGTDKQKDSDGYDYCFWCEKCLWCQEYLEQCSCIDTNNINIILGK